MLFRYRVIVMPKGDLLDPQGRAVRGVLKDLGWEVSDVRIGKSIVVEVRARDEDEAERILGEMAERVLSNPLVEDYEIERL